jgi:serine/threonine protein kinase/WD40 repeat protein
MDPAIRELFAAFLEAHPEAEREHFRAWSAEHEQHAEGLEAMMAELEALRKALDLPAGSIAAHLIESHGPDIDPGIQLAPRSSTGQQGPSEELTPHLPASAGNGRRYHIRRAIGHGGMGTVLEVWDRDLRRRVAMKVTRTGSLRTGDPRAFARFLEEAQITGQLDHPGVVPVHELGLDARGEVFFTMRLVRGRDLETLLAEMEAGKLSEDWNTARMLGALLKACESVAYAHSKGVIHRDLKPTNIMVGRFGEVYVMDWGLAKVLGRPEPEPVARPSQSMSRVASLREDLEDSSTDSPLFTRKGEVVGTPAYMSPEQARGVLAELGPPSDVYSLGAILYRLLTGTRPYDTGKRQTAREVMAAVATGPPAPVAERARQAPAELVAICDKAMARDPGDRYPTTEAMADDLRAFLEDRVVSALGSGPILELRKWCSRNRLVANIALIAVISVLATSLRSAWIQSSSNRKLREHQVLLQSLVSDDLVSRNPAQALAVALQMPRGEDEFPLRTAVLYAMGRLQEERLLEGFVNGSSPPSGDVIVGWHHDSKEIRVWSVPERRYTAKFAPPSEASQFRVRVSSDASCAIVWGGRRTFLLELGTGVWIELLHSGQSIECTAALSLPDSNQFLTGCQDGAVDLWSHEGLQLARLGNHGKSVTSLGLHPLEHVAVSMSGSVELTANTDRTVQLWSLTDGAALGAPLELDEEPLQCVFHPQEDVLMVGDLRGQVHRITWKEGVRRESAFQAPGQVHALAYPPQGDLLAVGYQGGMRVLDRQNSPVRIQGIPHGTRGVNWMTFDQEGKRLLTSGYDLSAQVWMLRKEGAWKLTPSIPARGHLKPIDAAMWLCEHWRFATTTSRGTHIWYGAGNPHLPRLRDEIERRPVTALALSPGADRLLLAREGAPVEAYRFEPGVSLEPDGWTRPPPVPNSEVVLIELLGDEVLLVWSHGLVEFLDGRTGVETRDPIGVGSPVVKTCLQAGTLLIGAQDAVVRISTETGEVQQTPLDHPITCLAVHPSGDPIGIGDSNGGITVRTRDDRTPFPPLSPPTRSQTGIFGLSFHPTEPELVSGGPDGQLRRWSTQGELLRTSGGSSRVGKGSTIGAVEYIGSGDRVLSHHMWGGTLWLSERESLTKSALGQPARTHSSQVVAYDLNGSRTRLLTASLDMTATWWNLETQRAIQTFRGHGGPLTAAVVSEDGQWAATGDLLGAVRLWPLDPVKQARAAMPFDPELVDTRQVFPEGVGRE